MGITEGKKRLSFSGVRYALVYRNNQNRQLFGNYSDCDALDCHTIIACSDRSNIGAMRAGCNYLWY